jgi:NADH/NAD ratio-sensing transcriptional regulator Rex
VANALDDVQATYSMVNQKYNLLRLACQNDTQRQLLGSQYANAQAAYLSCIGKMLADDDAAVALLSTQLKSANAVVAQSVTQMGDMSRVIDNITQAVTLGAQLVAAAGL